ncbi:MAG: HAD-IA family hydrolase [Tissierellia bacterium]|nr:HAD-IA family hydrolase [Tissierellia bacterium]
MKRKKLVFDMDGTLLESMYMWRNFMSLYKDFKFKKKIEEELPNLTKSSALAHSIIMVKQALNEDLDDNQIAQKIHAFLYKFYTSENRAKNTVENTIRNLHNKGFDIYLATATDYLYAFEGIKKANILEYFNKIYTPDKLGIKKYDIDYYKTIRDDLGVNSEDIIFFDDAYYALKLAKNAGFHTIGVHDDLAEDINLVRKFSDYFINDLSEIENIIDRI